ncbi:putative protein glutamine dumper [Helianthus annuus]|uniref:Uncharacterized protein n=1 Tax=Helianthus annuus TaxID=4232 RepID=A0A251T4G0_HELAN|nr:putative protein glutamine dumper [Helianthus annuus]KAJ0490696.1 putative protein glutamine dumper [Helianthus annuus]KAJ0494992.1 putative protein glutamine dumper [Helianthus annuus]KAJ0506617.1 putative protein glutamine dumper [Helianthus annuus]KAJ0676291.1 putative protein glutamine dumper [Helianthus annuus]
MSSSKTSSSFWRFDSPSVYLFGGIAAMLAMIVVALVILTCYQRSATAGQDIETGKPTKLEDGSNVSPKFVVILAGDNIPTYFAAPAGVK